MPDKTSLRKQFRTLRGEIAIDEHNEAERRIVDSVRGLKEFVDARIMHSYWPVTDRREIDVRPLIHDVAARGGRVILPVVTVFGPRMGRRRLAHVEYLPGMPMKPNRWHIPEPVGGRPAPVEQIDLILVPALACDTVGHRLGQGLGYYDEFLADTPGIRLCVCLDLFLVDEIAHEPHDERVDIIVTESRIIRTPDRNAP